jgi:hypothetical protein
MGIIVDILATTIIEADKIVSPTVATLQSVPLVQRYEPVASHNLP